MRNVRATTSQTPLPLENSDSVNGPRCVVALRVHASGKLVVVRRLVRRPRTHPEVGVGNMIRRRQQGLHGFPEFDVAGVRCPDRRGEQLESRPGRQVGVPIGRSLRVSWLAGGGLCGGAAMMGGVARGRPGHPDETTQNGDQCERCEPTSKQTHNAAFPRSPGSPGRTD